MAIVSLRSQRITIYDADGWILRAPVSSGQAGRETPAGIAGNSTLTALMPYRQGLLPSVPPFVEHLAADFPKAVHV